ncbi:MAG: hypothetical protein DHS20C07_04440 [Methyloligella sp.]|nr:MAG: hypothetical protein DHS20C07_04440 [Methyloligella sp.]
MIKQNRIRYKASKPVILEWKQSLKKPNLERNPLSQSIRESTAAKLVDDFFLMEDEAPPTYPILSSVYYSEYSFHCLENEVTPLSRRAFSILAKKFVISKKGKYGMMWYTLRPQILKTLHTNLKNKIAS